MKQVQTILLLLFIMVCFSGCGDKTSLTEEENALIAEYAAKEVLQANPEYDEGLAKTEATTETASGEAQATTEAEVTTEATLENPVNPTASDDAVQANTVTTLSELYSGQQLEVSYSGYKLTKSYQDSQDGSLAIEPYNGGKLLVVKLGIKNVAGKINKVDLLDAGYQYDLKTPTGSYASLLTVANTDFSVYQRKMKKDEAQKVMLFFEIPKNTTKPLNGYTLHITNGNNSADVVIQ